MGGRARLCKRGDTWFHFEPCSKNLFKEYFGKNLSVFVRVDSWERGGGIAPILFFPETLRWEMVREPFPTLRQILTWQENGNKLQYVPIEFLDTCHIPTTDLERDHCNEALRRCRDQIGYGITLKTVSCLTERHYAVCGKYPPLKPAKGAGRPRKRPAGTDKTIKETKPEIVVMMRCVKTEKREYIQKSEDGVIEVIAKIDSETGQVTFFFPETVWMMSSGEGHVLGLMSWTQQESHSDASHDYMLKKCHFPATDAEREAVEKAVEFYIRHYSVTGGFRRMKRVLPRHRKLIFKADV
jgi:hypothetical protein